MKIGSIVKYINPFPTEGDVRYTVIEIDESTNWCLIKANVGMGSFNPTYTANISDLIETISLSGIMINL